MLNISEYLDHQNSFFKSEILLLLEKIRSQYQLEYECLDGRNDATQDRNADVNYFVDILDSNIKTYSQERMCYQINIVIASPYDDENQTDYDAHERPDNNSPVKTIFNAIYQTLNMYLKSPVDTNIIPYSYTINGTTKQSFPFDWSRYINENPVLKDYLNMTNRDFDSFISFPVVYTNLKTYLEDYTYRIVFEFDPVTVHPYTFVSPQINLIKELTGYSNDEVMNNKFMTFNEETIKNIGAWQT